MKKRNNKNTEIVPELSNPLDTSTQNGVKSDVDGSYTGHPTDDEKPVQDADDL